MEESTATTGTPAATATAAAGLGLGVGGWSSPSLSGGSTLRSASIIALGGGGGWASGIVSVQVSGEWCGSFVRSPDALPGSRVLAKYSNELPFLRVDRGEAGSAGTSPWTD